MKGWTFWRSRTNKQQVRPNAIGTLARGHVPHLSFFSPLFNLIQLFFIFVCAKDPPVTPPPTLKDIHTRLPDQLYIK